MSGNSLDALFTDINVIQGRIKTVEQQKLASIRSYDGELEQLHNLRAVSLLAGIKIFRM